MNLVWTSSMGSGFTIEIGFAIGVEIGFGLGVDTGLGFGVEAGLGFGVKIGFGTEMGFWNGLGLGFLFGVGFGSGFGFWNGFGLGFLFGVGFGSGFLFGVGFGSGFGFLFEGGFGFWFRASWYRLQNSLLPSVGAVHFFPVFSMIFLHCPIYYTTLIQVHMELECPARRCNKKMKNIISINATMEFCAVHIRETQVISDLSSFRSPPRTSTQAHPVVSFLWCLFPLVSLSFGVSFLWSVQRVWCNATD
jgi:hypothetical protein